MLDLTPPRISMRVVIAGLANQVAADDRSPRTKEILKKLDEPISMSFSAARPRSTTS